MRTYLIIFGLVFLAILAAIFLSTLSSEEKQAPHLTLDRQEEISDQSKTESTVLVKKPNEAALLNLFNTPISFWGKVEDLQGNPVANAEVILGANDQYWKAGSSYTVTTDSSGLFSITDIRGISLSVRVSKQGYASTKTSKGHFNFVNPSENKTAIPSEKKPALFKIRSLERAEPLKRNLQRFKINKIGDPVYLNLSDGIVKQEEMADIVIQAWSDDENKNPNGHYDWRYRLYIPNGGIIERMNSSELSAPNLGFKESASFFMNADSQSWNPQHNEEYFLKLPDSTFARISFTMIAGGDHFFVIESYVNPSGSRNLEYDPAKRINP